MVKIGINKRGAFSSTTTMDGKAIMWIGGVDGGDNLTGGTEAVQTGYTYTMNLNTSFTGDDNLYVRLRGGDKGNMWELEETYHIDSKDTSNEANNDSYNVDNMWYAFPVGYNITAFLGPTIETDYMYVTPSIYQPGFFKSMKLGGLSNFGDSHDREVGAGFKWETDDGFTIASNIVDENANIDGILSNNSRNKWDTQIAYTTDR